MTDHHEERRTPGAGGTIWAYVPAHEPRKATAGAAPAEDEGGYVDDQAGERPARGVGRPQVKRAA